MDYNGARIAMPADIAVHDISKEMWRQYLMSSGQVVHIEKPVALHVTATGSHYVVNEQGVATYIAPKFDAIQWNNREGEPRINFVSPRS